MGRLPSRASKRTRSLEQQEVDPMGAKDEATTVLVIRKQDKETRDARARERLARSREGLAVSWCIFLLHWKTLTARNVELS